MTTLAEITAETTSRFLRTSPFRIRYYEAGPAIRSSRWHGSGSSTTDWSDFSPAFRRTG
jgi:hypothetical protein